MNRDEQVSREELAAFAEYTFAKISRVEVSISILIDVLALPKQADTIRALIATDPLRGDVATQLYRLAKFEELRNIADRYIDRGPEGTRTP